MARTSAIYGKILELLRIRDGQTEKELNERIGLSSLNGYLNIMCDNNQIRKEGRPARYYLVNQLQNEDIEEEEIEESIETKKDVEDNTTNIDKIQKLIVSDKTEYKYKDIFRMPVLDLTIESYILHFLIEQGLEVDDDNLVKLTKHNSKIVEKFIKEGIIDEDNFVVYASPYFPNAKNLYMSYCKNKKKKFDFKNITKVYLVLKQIDKDNSTQDFKHKYVCCRACTNYIVNNTDDFLKKLNGDIKDIQGLVHDMCNIVQEQSENEGLGKYEARSLVSKICKYLHEFRFKADKFYIYDSVVCSILPVYFKKFGIETTGIETDNWYQGYFDLINQVFEHREWKKMTKTQFDHLLWFCYRNWDKK